MLPEFKNDFPKCLYLDQNKWIDLARAHYGRPEGQPFQDALRAVRTATEAGRLIVPFSVVNAVEAMIPRDAARRERLARFMVELSGNRTTLPDPSACRWEIRNAIGRLLCKGSTTAVRPLVVRQGLSNALDLGFQVFGPTAARESAIGVIDATETTLAFLLRAGGKRDYIEQSRAGEAAAVSVFERDRTSTAGMSLERRRALEFRGLFSSMGLCHPPLVLALQELGLTREEFRAQFRSAQDTIRFLADIPNLDVLLTLRLIRDQDLARPIAHNDIRDLTVILG